MIIALRIGGYIAPRRPIIQPAVVHWKYARECASVLGGIMPGTKLKIVQISTTPGAMWVQVELPGRFPVETLKISGEEFAMNFEMA